MKINISIEISAEELGVLVNSKVCDLLSNLQKHVTVESTTTTEPATKPEPTTKPAEVTKPEPTTKPAEVTKPEPTTKPESTIQPEPTTTPESIFPADITPEEKRQAILEMDEVKKIWDSADIDTKLAGIFKLYDGMCTHANFLHNGREQSMKRNIQLMLQIGASSDQCQKVLRGWFIDKEPDENDSRNTNLQLYLNAFHISCAEGQNPFLAILEDATNRPLSGAVIIPHLVSLHLVEPTDKQRKIFRMFIPTTPPAETSPEPTTKIEQPPIQFLHTDDLSLLLKELSKLSVQEVANFLTLNKKFSKKAALLKLAQEGNISIPENAKKKDVIWAIAQSVVSSCSEEPATSPEK